MAVVDGFTVGVAEGPPLPRGAVDALALIQAGVAKLNQTDVDTYVVGEALALISSVEDVARQVDGARAKVLASVERTGVYAVDGHRNAKPMVASTAKLSGGEVKARANMARVLDVLPTVAGHYVDGEISTCMVRRLGRAYTNPRVRDLMADADGWFAGHALKDTYEFFDLVVSQWVELADQDGAERRDKRHDRARNHVMTQDEDGEWHWSGSCSAYDGAITKDILDAFAKVEFDIDWQWAVDNYGPEANSTHMPRTAAQRRADAFAKVHVYAGKALQEETGHTVTTDVVIDDETFERHAAALAGEDDLPADDPCRDDYRCDTLTGHRLSPRSAVARALLGYLRRNVIGADSVTTDLGRRRLFTGYARLAAQLNLSECYWPGCHVNVNICQVDHLTPHSERDGPGGPDPGGGLTNPANAAPCCVKHNRHKEHGYRVIRRADGTIHIQRPDGTTLE